MVGSRWLRRTLAIVAVLGVVAVGCGDDDDDAAAPDDTAADDADAETYEVQVDAKPDDAGTTFFAFFPSDVAARPGDTVEFHSVFTGEPHTVALGTTLDDTLALIDELAFDLEGEEPPPPELEEAFARIPFLFPDDPEATQPNQAAAQPCFLETGVPEAPADPCPAEAQEQPAFTGAQSFYSSGFLPDEAVFSIEIADDAQPGDYTYMCLVHGPEMTGVLTVAAPDAAVPTADEVAAERDQQLEAALDELQPIIDRIRDASDAGAAPAGGFPESEEPPIRWVNAFPDEIGISAGESVTWDISVFHTISFNAPEDARPFIRVESDGTVVFVEKSSEPAGWAGPPDGGGPPEGEEAPPEPVRLDAGTWDGTGFHSSGFLEGEGDGTTTYTLTFSEPGTYEYMCLVHPDMEGTVTVT